MKIPCRKYLCAYVLAQPRYGKGALTKDLAVKLSATRKMCFMDYKGEWSRHVTHPNYKSRQPNYIANFKVFRGFTFKLSDFMAAEDWVSMGFNRAVEIRNIFDATFKQHNGDPNIFLKILADLPTETKNTVMTVDEFNGRYGTEMHIGQHQETKASWIRNLEKVKRWFWTGKDDPRPIYDFGEEWVRHQNIFIDFSSDFSDSDTRHRNRTFFGKIMEKLAPHYRRLQGVIIVEEADILLPRWPLGDVKPSSNIQVIHYVAKAPKYGMGIVLIMQHLKQSDEDIRIGGQFMYLLGMYQGYPYPFKAKPWMTLRYYPEKNYREFLFMDVNVQGNKFVPGVPCCEFESNIKEMGI